MALTKAKLEELAGEIAVLADVASAAIAAVSGWDISYLYVAKSGNWMFLSGAVYKSSSVIATSATKVAIMAAGYRPGVTVYGSAVIGSSVARAVGEVYIETDGDVYVYSTDGSNQSYASFTIIYPIA